MHNELWVWGCGPQKRLTIHPESDNKAQKSNIIGMLHRLRANTNSAFGMLLSVLEAALEMTVASQDVGILVVALGRMVDKFGDKEEVWGATMDVLNMIWAVKVSTSHRYNY